MTNRQKDFRIAELCGWKREKQTIEVGFICSVDEERDGWRSAKGVWYEGESHVPFFTKELGALLEALSVQKIADQENIIRKLVEIIFPKQYLSRGSLLFKNITKLMTCEPILLAEAFLSVLNKPTN